MRDVAGDRVLFALTREAGKREGSKARDRTLREIPGGFLFSQPMRTRQPQPCADREPRLTFGYRAGLDGSQRRTAAVYRL